MLMSCSIIQVVNVHVQAGARVHELLAGGAHDIKPGSQFDAGASVTS